MDKGFIFRREKYYGPLDVNEIKELISRGMLTTQHHFWQPGMSNWTPICQLEGFRAYQSLNDLNMDDEEFEKVIRLDSRFSRIREPKELNIKSQNELKMGTPLTIKEDVPKLNESVDIPVVNKFSIQEFLVEHSLKIAIVGLVITVAFALMVLFSKSEQEKKILASLNKVQLHEVNRVLDLSESSSTPQAAVSLVNRNNNNHLVIATNVAEGAVLEINIEGEPETLIGQHYMKLNFNIKVQNPLFEINPIVQKNGGPLPRGKYNVSIICKTCGLSRDYKVQESSFFVGSNLNNEQYQLDLMEYHQEVRELANVELVELSQIIGALKSQFLKSKRVYKSVSKKKWQNFSKNWMKLQSSIVEAFYELNDPAFFNKLYYKDVYIEMRNVSESILKLHREQNVNMMNGDLGYSEAIKEQNDQIKNDIRKAIKNLDIKKTYYINSSGMPPRKGT